jgi:acetyltransferase
MPTIERLEEKEAWAMMAELIALLQDSINSGASLGFLPPLTAATAEDYWLQTLREVTDGSRLLLVSLEAGEIAGSVQAALAMKQNGLHRAEVQKLMVHTRYRNRGIARGLLKALEDEAQQMGRTLLVLDTELGSPAENLYPSCGYVRVGNIPQFARKTDGDLVATVVFYKTLNSA